MRRLFSVFAVIVVAHVFACVASALNCKGTVVDENGEPIIGASIVVTNGSPLGTTDVDGNFSVNVPSSAKSLTFSYVGCKSKELAPKANMGRITLETASEILADVVVTQSLARTRQTPVALSQVSGPEIEVKLGTQELLVTYYSRLNFLRRLTSMSCVIVSRSYSGFQSHSSRAQLSSSESGQESAMC